VTVCDNIQQIVSGAPWQAVKSNQTHPSLQRVNTRPWTTLILGFQKLTVFRRRTLLSSRDVAPCQMLAPDHSFGGKYYLHIQVKRRK